MPPREGTRARHTIPRATRSRDRRAEAHLSSDGRAYDVSGGGGTDKFRIKIWDKLNGDAIVYDNNIGAADDAEPTTALTQGSIKIHKD